MKKPLAMNTKSILAAALIAVTGVLSSQAQTSVFSVNIVGFTKKTLPPGFTMFANPLGSSNMSIAALIPSPPAGTALYKFNGSAYNIAEFNDGNWEFGGPVFGLAPGEGAFIQNTTGSNFTLTFKGEVILSSSNAIPSGFSVRSSVIPQSAPIQTVLNFPISNGDTIYRFNGSGYNVHDYNDNAWDQGEPVPAVGESFFVYNASGAKNWVRNFTVGP